MTSFSLLSLDISDFIFIACYSVYGLAEALWFESYLILLYEFNY